jgi:anoctamin-10
MLGRIKTRPTFPRIGFATRYAPPLAKLGPGRVCADHLLSQFGDAVALYFVFLRSYTHALIFPAALGFIFFFFGTPYSPIYSSLLVLWSIIFVEWWRVQERIISLRYGSRGSFKVEKRRAQYVPGVSWWQREVRILCSLPVIIFFAGILIALTTAIFIAEAFVTQLYNRTDFLIFVNTSHYRSQVRY